MAIDTPTDFISFLDSMKPDETPFLTRIGGPPKPDYYWPTITRPNEPFHTYWKKLGDIIADIRDDYCPESEWNDDCQWTPSEEFYRLERLHDEMHQLAHYKAPNPQYDQERAEAWDKIHPPNRPLNQKKVEWGTGFVIPESDHGKFAELGQERENGLPDGDE